MTTVARHPSAHTVSETRQGERGFTLIELSIVLVIIGLLIGGILQGQEMINNTRLKSTIAQVDALTAATQTFQDKYRQLPGDADATVQAVIGSTVAGNGNRAIAQIAGGAAAQAARNLTQGTAEAPLALDHLINANLLAGAVANGATTAYEARLDNTFLDLVTVNDFTDAAGAAVAPRLAVRFRGNSGVAAPTAGVAPADAFSIDVRYDDGNPSVGRFQSQGAACIDGTPAYVGGTDQTCTSGMSIN